MAVRSWLAHLKEMPIVPTLPVEKPEPVEISLGAVAASLVLARTT
jgi:hypothetical protein